MTSIRQYQRTCSICGKSKLCACVSYSANPQADKPPVVTIIPAKRMNALEMVLEGNPVREDELYICGGCAKEKGRAPKKLWMTWILSWVALIAGLAMNMLSGTATNPVGLILGAAGAWTMLFSELFLVVKANRGIGSLLLGLLSVGPLGLIILPLLRKDINRNERIVTALIPVASERLKEKDRERLDRLKEKDRERLDRLVRDFATYLNLGWDQSELDKMERQLLAEGDAAENAIFGFLARCSYGGVGEIHWWNKAKRLTQMLPKFKSPEVKRHLEQLVDNATRTNIWEYHTEIANVAKEELAKL